MTPTQLAEALEQEHQDYDYTPPVCGRCGQKSPCTARQAAKLLRTLPEEVESRLAKRFDDALGGQLMTIPAMLDEIRRLRTLPASQPSGDREKLRALLRDAKTELFNAQVKKFRIAGAACKAKVEAIEACAAALGIPLTDGARHD